jgi:hypothetical protein
MSPNDVTGSFGDSVRLMTAGPQTDWKLMIAYAAPWGSRWSMFMHLTLKRNYSSGKLSLFTT